MEFDVKTPEQGSLRRNLLDAGHGSILDSVQAQDRDETVDSHSFRNSLHESLDTGSFRLVFVLGEVPVELERVVACVGTVTVQELTIDLITLRMYDINGKRVAFP